MSKSHIKFGGVGFNAKASSTKINRFVNNLPDNKRQSLSSLAEELQAAGLIETTKDLTHKHNRGVYNAEEY